MGAFELQIFVSLVVVLGAAFAALICDFLKGNNEQLRETNVELRVRQDERERQQAERELLQQQLLQQIQRQAAALPVSMAPAPPVASAAPAPTEDETRALFARASTGNRRRGAHHQDVAQWANELLEKKQKQEAARLAELKARIEAREHQPAPPAPAPVAAPVAESAAAPVAPVAPPEEKLPPQAGRVDLPALAGTAPAPALARVPDAAALLAEPAALTPHFDFTLVQPVPRAAAPAAPVEEKLPPQAGRVDLPALAGTAPAPALARVPDAAALLAESAALTPHFDFTLVQPVAPSAASLYRLSVYGADVARGLRESAATPLTYAAEVVLPALALRIEATLPVIELAEAPATPALVADAVRIRVIDEAALAPEAEEPEIAVELAPAETEPSLPGMAALQSVDLPPALVPASPAAAGPVFHPAPELTLSLPVFDADVLTFESATPSLEEEQSGVRANVVQLPVAVHVEPVLDIPNGLRPAAVLAHLLEAPEYYTGLVLSVGVVEFAKLVSEHGKPAVEQVLIALERTLLSVAREQDMVCRVRDDEWMLLCPRELAGAAKRRATLLSERLWDFQLRSLGGVSIFFSWGAGEGQNERLGALAAQAHDEMQESRHMRRGAINLAPRTRRRAANG